MQIENQVNVDENCKCSVNNEMTEDEKKFMIHCAVMAVCSEYHNLLKEVLCEEDGLLSVVDYFKKLTEIDIDLCAKLYIEDYNRYHRRRFGVEEGEKSITPSEELEKFFKARYLELALKHAEAITKQLKKHSPTSITVEK